MQFGKTCTSEFYIVLYKSNKILARFEMDPLFVVCRVKMKTFLIFLNVTRTT